MACFLNGIVVFVVVLGIFVKSQVNVDNDENIEPFSLLCRIYNVAKNPPITDVDLQEPHKIVEEIDALNRSLLEEKTHDKREEAGNHSEVQVKPTVTRETQVAQISLNQITQKAHAISEKIKKINFTENIGKVKADFAQVIFAENGNESDLE
ncbi:unnamed protein product, partial [Trypanosoma congolense IL3000]